MYRFKGTGTQPWFMVVQKFICGVVETTVTPATLYSVLMLVIILNPSCFIIVLMKFVLYTKAKTNKPNQLGSCVIIKINFSYSSCEIARPIRFVGYNIYKISIIFNAHVGVFKIYTLERQIF